MCRFERSHNMHVIQVKGIIQPQSRWVSIDSPRLRTQSPMFFVVHFKGYSRALNLNKPIIVFSA
jgi:hypothetical protein